jgi:hypothetical protein
MAARNQDADHSFTECDPITDFYLEALFKGKI